MIEQTSRKWLAPACRCHTSCSMNLVGTSQENISSHPVNTKSNWWWLMGVTWVQELPPLCCHVCTVSNHRSLHLLSRRAGKSARPPGREWGPEAWKLPLFGRWITGVIWGMEPCHNILAFANVLSLWVIESGGMYEESMLDKDGKNLSQLLYWLPCSQCES